MTTTLKDKGRMEGQVPYHYAFPFKLWFKQDQILPDSVLQWCRDNLEPPRFYKVWCYTHNSSVRVKYSRSNEFEKKVIFVDHIFLSHEDDVARLKLEFDVTDEAVKRPEKLKRRRRKRRVY